MQKIEIEAFAKINIGLTVFGKRASGYHDIESIFQNVDISDLVMLSIVEGAGIEVHGDLGCAPERSTVYQAIAAFQRECGAWPNHAGVQASVTKRIPSGAGLGGAGADAAATILGLDRLFATRMSRAELADIGAMVASDVPFFIYGGAAVVRGRGDIVEPIQPREDFGLLVIKPSWDSKTPEAYAILDGLRARGELSVPKVSRSTEALVEEYARATAAWSFRNDFEPALRRQQVDYSTLIEIMLECGADFISLSGSGSCFFGTFQTKLHAIEASKKYRELLHRRGERGLLPTTGIFATQPLARSIKVSYIQGCSEDTWSDKERPCYGSD